MFLHQKHQSKFRVYENLLGNKAFWFWFWLTARPIIKAAKIWKTHKREEKKEKDVPSTPPYLTGVFYDGFWQTVIFRVCTQYVTSN